jgi:hypothetical protein
MPKKKKPVNLTPSQDACVKKTKVRLERRIKDIRRRSAMHNRSEMDFTTFGYRIRVAIRYAKKYAGKDVKGGTARVELKAFSYTQDPYEEIRRAAIELRQQGQRTVTLANRVLDALEALGKE